MPRNNFYDEDTQDKKKYYKDECPVCGEHQFYKEPKRRHYEDCDCYPPCPDWLRCPPPWYWCKPEPEKECKKDKCERDDCCDDRKDECKKKEKVCEIENYAYVYVLSSTATIVAAGSDLIFTSNGPIDGITHTPNTAQIYVRRSGEYWIRYFLALTAASAVGATIGLAVNGAVDPSTVIAVPVITATGVSGEAILRLRCGDFLTLRNNSTAAQTITLAVAPAVGAQLTMFRLDEYEFPLS